MTTTEQRGGTAGAQGTLWGARARDWADHQEPAQRQVYENALRLAGVRAGRSVLDAGCGSGGLSRLAAEAGATITGIDAAQPLVEIASERIPAGRFDVGD